MKNQALFSSKEKSKKLKYRLLQLLFGTLRVKSRHILVGFLLKQKPKVSIWNNDLVGMWCLSAQCQETKFNLKAQQKFILPTTQALEKYYIQ